MLKIKNPPDKRVRRVMALIDARLDPSVRVRVSYSKGAIMSAKIGSKRLMTKK